MSSINKNNLISGHIKNELLNNHIRYVSVLCCDFLIVKPIGRFSLYFSTMFMHDSLFGDGKAKLAQPLLIRSIS